MYGMWFMISRARTSYTEASDDEHSWSLTRLNGYHSSLLHLFFNNKGISPSPGHRTNLGPDELILSYHFIVEGVHLSIQKEMCFFSLYGHGDVDFDTLENVKSKAYEYIISEIDKLSKRKIGFNNVDKKKIAIHNQYPLFCKEIDLDFKRFSNELEEFSETKNSKDSFEGPVSWFLEMEKKELLLNRSVDNMVFTFFSALDHLSKIIFFLSYSSLFNDRSGDPTIFLGRYKETFKKGSNGLSVLLSFCNSVNKNMKGSEPSIVGFKDFLDKLKVIQKERRNFLLHGRSSGGDKDLLFSDGHYGFISQNNSLQKQFCHSRRFEVDHLSEIVDLIRSFENVITSSYFCEEYHLAEMGFNPMFGDSEIFESEGIMGLVPFHNSRIFLGH